MGIDPQRMETAAKIQFRNGSEIVEFFQQCTGTHFIDWFNAACAKKGSWAGKSIGSSPQVKSRFLQIWDNASLAFEKLPVNLIQFAALMSVIVAEAGADLLPASELCGCDNHPGLTYPFEAVPGIKQSYNCGQGNKRAGDLFFSDEHFWNAHGSLPGGDLVRALPNLHDMWNSAFYPGNLFPTSLDPAHSGFIQQADFFKFRGRGFIQLTWRANYKLLVGFVQSYTGGNAVINRYKAAWAGKDPDVVCTISTNEDWDALFGGTELIVACRAIGLHNHAHGNYLGLSTDPQVLNAKSPKPGTLYAVGLRINGAVSYAESLSARVAQMLHALPH